MESIRQPAVAGTFYPADPVSLGNTVDQYLEAAGTQPHSHIPKAIIAPHAGYVYSGETAGSVYRQLLGLAVRSSVWSCWALPIESRFAAWP